MSEPTNHITAITAGTNPVTGIDSYVIEYDDGETQSHEGPWSEARELADRAGLTHREDGTHWTRWARRGLALVAAVAVLLTASCAPQQSEPTPTLIPPLQCRQTPSGPVCAEIPATT